MAIVETALDLRASRNSQVPDHRTNMETGKRRLPGPKAVVAANRARAAAEPMAAEGNVIRTDDLLYFGGRDPQTGVMDPALPETFERKIISVDASFKDLRTSDRVAIVVIGVNGATRYLLHTTNAHLDLTSTENEIRNCHAAYGPISAVLVEDKANGPSVVAHLKEEIPGVIAVDPQGGKMARLVAASPEFQAGNWVLDRNGVWTHKVVEQLTMFPNCKADDIADAISQGSIWLQSHTYELGFIDYLKGVAAGLIRRPEPKPKSAATAPAAQPLPHASSRPKPDAVLPCPACQSVCTVRLGGAGNIHCNSCACDFDSQGNILTTRETVIVGVNCCPHPLKQVIGPAIRCGNCGKQASTENGGTNGMSFAQYEARRRSPYGRFSN